MFLRNFWYAAAWPSEIANGPLARTICGEPVVMFRATDGGSVALEDRCCHRNLPLSMGKVEGDNIRCGYHGLVFDRTGCCIEVPGQSQVPPGARVRAYPLVEKWKLLWIWMGDPALADEKAIPDWFYMDHPDWLAAHGNDEKPLYMRCNWELNNDNLLDLSHVIYVHTETLGGANLDRFPIRTDRYERMVSMRRFVQNVPPMPLFARYMNLSGNMDRWQESYITAPAHCVVDAGFAPHGQFAPNEQRATVALGFRALISATPETDTTSFMFYAQCRNFAKDNAELTKKFVADFRGVFLEDVSVMEAQQRVNSARPNAPMIDINADAPHLAMRQVVRRLAAAESASTARAAVA
jgi:phenylpropionate dioxygenase-like ring-hydroxylating dioxygenase large terminal subunit